jgi:hypothetical protein
MRAGPEVARLFDIRPFVHAFFRKADITAYARVRRRRDLMVHSPIQLARILLLAFLHAVFISLCISAEITASATAGWSPYSGEAKPGAGKFTH